MDLLPFMQLTKTCEANCEDNNFEEHLALKEYCQLNLKLQITENIYKVILL
jgi:hypothetical protein